MLLVGATHAMDATREGPTVDKNGANAMLQRATRQRHAD